MWNRAIGNGKYTINWHCLIYIRMDFTTVQVLFSFIASYESIFPSVYPTNPKRKMNQEVTQSLVTDNETLWWPIKTYGNKFERKYKIHGIYWSEKLFKQWVIQVFVFIHVQHSDVAHRILLLCLVLLNLRRLSLM